MSTRLQVRGLSCAIDGKPILEGIGFSLQPGELVGIVGPNGAGKSTLLKCLDGLLPARGEIRLQGHGLAEFSPRELARRVALMHQDTNPAFPFPVREVVMLGRYPHQSRFQPESAEDRRLVETMMARTDTAHLADQPITTLSGGERQRTLFAKVLVQDTGLLFLDEPSASLDIAHQEQLFGLAAAEAARGRTVLAAMHDLRLAARWCDRLLLMASGRLVAEGEPQAVLTKENLERAYGVRVRVFANHITGLLDFQLCRDGEADTMPHVHVIGGGGSAAGVLRLLGDEGYRVTAGVLAPGDSDLLVAAAYGMPVVTSQPFSPIGDAAFADNSQLAARAELTILCSLAFGHQNLRNLEAAAAAPRLVLLEDEAPEARDFSGGAGLALYRRLRGHATVLASKELPAWIADWGAAQGLHGGR